MTAAEPQVPTSKCCGSTAGPWRPTGERYPSGAQVLVCSTPCTPRGPLTDDRLGQIVAAADALVAAWAGRDEAMLITPLVMAAWGERIARVDVPALLAEVARLRALVVELTPPTGECQHESPFGRLCDLTTGHLGDHQRSEGTSVHSWMRATPSGAR